jgi:hypothetical protein
MDGSGAPEEQRSKQGRLAALAGAALLGAAMVAAWWPGTALYDSVDQYGQAVRGAYEDWHPPIMARLWAILHLCWDGQAPMFVLQAALYWLGLGLIAAALAGQRRRGGAAAVLAIGIWPVFSGWEAAVLKDAQLVAALVAAVGILGWWRLRGRRVPLWVAALAAPLILYATLVRGNAVFATVPLAFALAGWFGLRAWWMRAGAMLAATAAVLLVTPFVNHRLLGAEETGIARTLPTFDLAGIAHGAGPEAAPVLNPDLWQETEARHCYTPFFWDPYGDESRCGFIVDELDDAAPGSALFGAWAGSAARHPLAYAAHRLAHWNETLRWLVPRGRPLAAPPAESEPNALGLASPGPAAEPWAAAAGWLAASPFGWPILWLAAAAAALWAARRNVDSIAFALALSAATLEASFALVSISADLRYHLWPMLATSLAWVLLAGAPLPRRFRWIALAMGGVLLVAGAAARLALPPGGDSYAAMLAGG